MKLLTQEYIKSILHYEPTTGVFTWRKALNRRVVVGSVAGCARRMVIGIFGESIRAHRLAWLYMTGEWPKNEIDHKSTIPSDNKWTKLRYCSRCGLRRTVKARKPK